MSVVIVPELKLTCVVQALMSASGHLTRAAFGREPKAGLVAEAERANASRTS